MDNNTYRLKAYHFPYTQNRYAETRMKTGFYDKKGLIWIGTEGGGILYADLREVFYKQYIQKHANEISSIMMDNNDYIWLSTYHKGIM
ncbi:two-component regulator propeller domain-containing protein, partial [Bacteroides caecigallinarum]